MKTSEIKMALNAGYVFFYVQTDEIDRFIGDIQISFNKEEENWKVGFWDFEQFEFDKGSIIPFIENSRGYSLLVFKNLNWFLKDQMSKEIDTQIVTYFQNHLSEWETRVNRKAILIVGNEPFETAIPNEIKRDFLQVEFNLPTVEEIEKYLNNLIEMEKSNERFKAPNKQDKKDIIESCRGLTLKSIQNAISYSIIKNKGSINPKDIGELRKQEIEATVGLKVGSYDVSELLGYENIKDFVMKSINSPIAKGILIIGPPGTGKTHFCRYISSMTNKVMIEAELAEMQGSGLYGQAEQAWSNMIKTVKSIGNAVLFFDEIEKGLSATGKDASTDSTGKRSASMLLKFMGEDRPGIYIVATCNSIANLPPEYKRSERWDSIFYLGLPSEKELKAILDFYMKQYKVEVGKFNLKEMAGWSGAEVKTLCRIAAMMNVTLDKAAKYVIPISKTMKTEIDALEAWAKNNAIPASVSIDNGSKKRAVDY
jgi:SpoVK/Ycf46/Vps4 family AAA+-type ATPase